MITNEEILKLRNENGRKYSHTLKKYHPDLIKAMDEYNEHYFGTPRSFGERLFNYMYKVTEIPKCPLCGASTGFDEHNFKYRKYCGRLCVNKDPAKKQHMVETLQKKYGVSYITQTEYFKEKSKQTHLKHYGTTKVGWAKSSVDKRKNTLIEKYGVDHQFKSQSVIDKSLETKINRYGSKGPGKQKRRETCMKKYGVINYTMTEEYKDRIKQTYLKKYGVPVNKASIDGLLKIHNQMMLNYYEKYKDLNKNLILLTKKEDFLGKQYENTWKCKTCGKIFTTVGKYGIYPMCECEKKHRKQDDIVEYIKSFYPGEVKTNDRKTLGGKEMDIYLPELKLGIEFNGLYWHCADNHPEQNYHLYKTEQAEQRGIKLIQIFEDEWDKKQSIIKTKLRFLIDGSHFKSIYARNCVVRPIDKQTANKFNNKYHIQGEDKSSTFLGLFYRKYLVAVATFKYDSKKENSYILSRYCTISSRRIVGGLGKCMSFFVEQTKATKITTFADRRYSDGKMYKTLGFIKDSVSPPYYWYTRNFLTRIHRFNLRKNNIKRWDIAYDESWSESRLAKENHYVKIWDCGQIKFVYYPTMKTG